MDSTSQIIKQHLEQSQTIALFGHVDIDGDCLSAMLGLGTILENQGKKVTYYTPTAVGKSLHFVPGYEKIQTHFDYKSYDSIVFLDFTPYRRIKEFTQGHEDYFANNKVIIIDHHEGDDASPTDIVLKDTNASSACELLYEQITKRRPNTITPQIATYLYLGITTDAGNFMYETDSQRLFKNAAELIAKGADKKRVIDNIYYRNSLDAMKLSTLLIQRAVWEKDILRTYYEDEEIKKFQVDKEQADLGFYSLRTVYGPKIYIRIRQEGGLLKGSVRGNGEINCATLCGTLFQGGGHHNAAGFTFERTGDIQKGINHIITTMQDYINELKNKPLRG